MNNSRLTAVDSVNHPAHYTAGKTEVIDVLEDWVKAAPDPVLGGLQWQVIKYLSRMWLKNDPLEDAQKSLWYLRRLVQRLENTQTTTTTTKIDGTL